MKCPDFTAARVLASHVLNCAFAACALLGVAGQCAFARELPLRSVIDGRRVQPREAELKAIGASDLTPSEAAKVEDLYRELTRCEAVHCDAE